MGSSRHVLKTTTACSGAPKARWFSCARSDSWWATPARRTDVLPMPLGPYSSVRREAVRLAMMISDSRSRPKKKGQSASEYGSRPRYGDESTGAESGARCASISSTSTAPVIAASSPVLRPRVGHPPELSGNPRHHYHHQRPAHHHSPPPPTAL